MTIEMDKGTLMEMYQDRAMTQREISEEIGCSVSTVNRYINEYGVEKPQTEVWKDEGLLRSLYLGEGLSAREIGERFGISHKTVLYWLDEYGVERRDKECYIEEKNASNVPYFEHADPGGHERWQVGDRGSLRSVSVHRLVVVAEEGLEAVEGKVVHHKNHIPWDNRPSNLKLMDREDHSAYHRRF